MTRSLVISFFLTLSITAFSQASEKIVYRKLEYHDFKKLSFNDTSDVIVDLFFDKKDNTALGQMSFLPITVALFVISPQISAGLTLVSLPLFINGSYMMLKYRKKKLYMVLTEYEKTGLLPKWVKKKANTQLRFIELDKLEVVD